MLTYISIRTRKLKSLFYIRLSILCVALIFLFEGLSFLFMSIFLYQIDTILIFLSALFLLIGINYMMKDSFMSIMLITVSSIGILFCYLTFQSGAIKPSVEYGYPTLVWTGFLLIVGIIIQLILFMLTFYWGLKTWFNTPLLMKKDAIVFFLGVILCTVISSSIYLLAFWIPILILLSDIVFALGLIFIIIAIMRDPKLLYILPFTVYRIIVKDREGFPIYDHDWSKSEISETIFSGFINAVQIMSEEIMNIGGVVDIQLEEGILFLHNTELITVALVSSKSSKLLRECTQGFSIDFQQKFETELKKSIREPSKYESAYELIEKHFSNFPYRIIPSRKHPLLLSGKFTKIPIELDNKLRAIFKDKREYELIKAELIKSPLGVASDFFNLYDEIKKEMEQLNERDNKYLVKNSNENE